MAGSHCFALFFLPCPKGCLKRSSPLGQVPGEHFQKPFGRGAEGRVCDGMGGCFTPGTSHNAGRAQLGEQHSTQEQRVSKDGTWALQGQSGFEQENPEAFTIFRSWEQPPVVAG